jgi:hypothetical protein
MPTLKRPASISPTLEKPTMNSKIFHQVSDYRKGTLQKEYERGLWKDGGNEPNHSSSSASFLTTSVGTVKNAQVTSSSVSGDWRGTSGTLRQMPDIYSPLWLNSNLNLPRDRATINAWSRSFFALQSFVQNAINLHSTYPISKLNIKCPNRKVETFFNEMNEEIGLENICTDVAQEYWLLGEAFPHADLDDTNAKWRRIVLQNPDFIVVKKTSVNSEPIIMMKPDAELQRLVRSNKPADIHQRKQLNPTIIDHIKRGENIPLDNFYISHLARKLSPYETRGTGLPVSCFRQLMLFDQIRECYHTLTEVLTDQGFKKYDELIDFQETPDGIISTPKPGIKIACFNPETEKLEYHAATNSIVKEHDGDMVHFHGKKVDVLVTPGHNMWAKEKSYKDGWTDWELRTADSILAKKKYYKFRSHAKWEGETMEAVEVLGKEIPIKDYLKFLGYVISEGCVYEDYTKDPGGDVRKNRYDALVSITQILRSKCINDIRDNFNLIAGILGKHANNSILPAIEKLNHQEIWQASIHGKNIVAHLKKEISYDLTLDCNSYNKRIPRWALNLNSELLTVLLDALVNGDGSVYKSKYGTGSVGTRYCTVSKQLADDVYELAFKCGYVPNICISIREEDGRPEYQVLWSSTEYGREPNVLIGKIENGNGGGATATKKHYKGKVFCLTVPTGLMVTRLNHKITIQGNCKFTQAQDLINPITLVKIGGADFKATPEDLEIWRNAWAQALSDKNFKIFTHEAVTVERIGANSSIIDTSGDITQLLKEIFMGLMIPEVIMTGGGDISYANGGISLDVLRQRYMQFRNMMASWLKNKIFAPISRLNDFYEYVDGEKKLIIPDVEWNRLTMFDTMDYINILLQLSTGEDKRVSRHALYDALGLEGEEERRKIRHEDVQEAIRKKEKDNLAKMSLNELRSLSDDDEIPEITDTANPSDSPYDMGALPGQTDAGGLGGGSPMPGIPDLGGLGGGGSMSPPPPPPSSPPPGDGGPSSSPPPAPPA